MLIEASGQPNNQTQGEQLTRSDVSNRAESPTSSDIRNHLQKWLEKQKQRRQGKLFIFKFSIFKCFLLP